ncbi:serine/threonine protein kinase [Candidatus Merdisoma sp. JLR.KK006]|uniref:serine/threonine protein kinase n=1 Tax=Candidatus Merdisoma sp. JLR.KK006 TaxID=3112626 RepID=UPI002FEEA676
MDLTTFVHALVLAMSIPSGITGFCFWLLERRMEKREKERVKKEAVREKQEFLIVKSIGAAISLGEATAEAVARIPDSHCNGDMHKALEYAREVKHEQKDFLTQQGIEAIY